MVSNRKFIVLFLVLICMVLICVNISTAKLYKWVDENGVTHFSNTAPPQDENDVQAQGEVKNSGSGNSYSPGIDHVINSYRRDNLQHDLDKAQRIREHQRSKSGGGSGGMADYYKGRLEDAKAEVELRREKLTSVERESYSDYQSHNERVRYYKGRLKDAELDVERYKRKYENSK